MKTLLFNGTHFVLVMQKKFLYIMLYNILALLLFIVPIQCFGQEVVATQGETLIGPNGGLEYTVGEVVISTISNGDNTLTQGFHQTKTGFIFLKIIESNPEIIVSIYPNPVIEVLNIETNLYKNTIFTLYNAKGKVIIEKELTSITTSLDVTKLATGGYFIFFRNDELKINVKTHIIIKPL